VAGVQLDGIGASLPGPTRRLAEILDIAFNVVRA
jgi:hypothetical protein